MTKQVTSWFIDQLFDQATEPKRVFTIAGSDYSKYVLAWPRVKNKWDQIQPVQLNMRLANEDRAFNFFITDKSTLVNSVELKFGFTHPTSGDELITEFAGNIEKIRFRDTTISLSVRDKLKAFTNVQIGTPDTPVSYTTTDRWPQDIMWDLITSYGGLDSTQDSSNPDIDWTSFQAWGNVFSTDQIFVRAHFEDKKLGEVMTKISRMTHTGIFIEDNKLFFTRFTLASSDNLVLEDANVKSIDVSLRDDDLVNWQWVYGAFDTTSGLWGIHLFDQSSTSGLSFGRREGIIKDENIWYVDSVGCNNLAERLISTVKEPVERYEIRTTLKPFAMQIGDTIKLSNSYYGISCTDHYRLMAYEVDLNDGSMVVTIDKSQIGNAFVLDDSYWGLLDLADRGTLL